jgi:PAS domain S-box-containing protein
LYNCIYPNQLQQVVNIQADVDAIGSIAIVPQLLEVICRTTGMGFAAIARVTEDKWVACSVRDEIQFGLEPGGELKLETTICHEIRQSGDPVIIDQVCTDPQFAEHHTPAMYGFQSYISVPIVRRDGTFFGTLCAIDPEPAKLHTPQIIGMFTLFTDLISFHLEAIEQLKTAETELVAERKNVVQQGQNNQDLSAINHELAATQQNLKNVVSQLTESEEKLRQAIDTGHMGTWSVDPVTYKVSISAFIKEMFGFSHDENVVTAKLLNAIDPAHRETVVTVMTDAVKSPRPSDIEFPIINALTQERKWVRATGRMFNNREGKAVEYSGMVMDVTERKLDDIRKNDFIGMVSHELKTPLTTLTAYVQLLHAKALKNADTSMSGALEKANLQVKKMSSMINGFLNVSRLESGKLHLKKERFLLNGLIETIIEEMALTSTTHTITQLPSEPIYVMADSDKIGNVISNLLSNAVKYSPLGNAVEVKCEVADNAARVSIRDEGMGIKPADLDKLFDRFYRVDNQHTRYISGFGIGLYLCAEIIKSHGGQITVESQSDAGSTFSFSLPLAL